MKAPLAATFLLTFAACGPQAPGAATFSIDWYASAALADVITFQISALTNKNSVDCFMLTSTPACIKEHGFAANRFVTFKDRNNRDVKTLSFGKAVSAQGTQQLTVPLPVNTDDFALIVEALTADATPKLAGIGCGYVNQAVTTGMNEAVPVKLTIWKTPANCDPRF